MPAFIDPDSTATFTHRAHVEKCEKVDCDCPPACICPGSPHPYDTVVARNRLGASDAAQIGRVFWAADQKLVLLSVALKSWTYTDAKGAEVPVSAASINLLDPDLADELADWVDREITKAKLPNPSGARSQPSSPAESSALTPTPTTTPST